MRKPTNERIERNGLRLLAVVSLACTLAAFGCTTNRMPGNGQPAAQTPAVGPANTSSTPGSSSGTTNPPMASGGIVVDPTRPLAVDAQATLAADQAYQGRVLGAANPPMTTQSNAPTTPTGQFVNPALIVNPQSTVNSSISSAVMAPTALTTVPMSGDASSATGTSAVGTNSAVSTMSNATLATPTNSAIATPALATAPAATSTTARATTTSTTAKTAKATTTSKTSKKKSAKVTTKATAAATTQPVHVETSVNGDVVVTNTTNPPQHQ